MIDESTSKVAMGHLEINGFKATRGHMMETGMDTTVFDKFDAVYSGHFHTRSTNGKIHYLGNPYEMFWNDVNDTRGFHFFDTETCIHIVTIMISCDCVNLILLHWFKYHSL